VGVELEYIVAHRDDKSRLMRRSEFELFLQIMERHGFNRLYSQGQTARISRDLAPGYIVVEPDFAYHLLEIALPPRRDPGEIRQILDLTLAQTDAALATLGFRRLAQGVIENPNQISFDCVNLSRLDGFVDGLIKARNSGKTDSPFFLPNFGAFLAATHVHLNAADGPESIALLPAMFETEWLAQFLFSRCQQFRGQHYGNARSLIYTETFPDTYELVHVPHVIPRSLSDLADSYERSVPRLFPNEPVLGVKDMSAIRVKPFGTFEFRSACSMHTVDEILAVASFRIAQLLYAVNYKEQLINGPDGWQREASLSIARPSLPQSAIWSSMQASLVRFDGILRLIPRRWHQYLPSLPRNVESLQLKNVEANHA
jgi:hypothetical protein